MFDQFERSLFLHDLWNNAPQSTTISFFFYLSIFPLDIVPRPRPSFIGRVEKWKPIFQGFDSMYRETRKHFVIFLRLVFPRHNDFSRSNVFDRNTANMVPIVPFLWFPIPISRTNAFSVLQDNSPLYYIDQRNGFTLSRARVSRAPALHVTLEFRANISSLIHKGERWTRSAISVLQVLRQSSIRTIFYYTSAKVDQRRVELTPLESDLSIRSVGSLWKKREREREKLSLESLVQFRIVDCVSGFNRWLTCAREALVRVSAPLLTVAIKLGGTCNSAIRSPMRPWSFPLNIFFRNSNYPFLFFLFLFLTRQNYRRRVEKREYTFEDAFFIRFRLD